MHVGLVVASACSDHPRASGSPSSWRPTAGGSRRRGRPGPAVAPALVALVPRDTGIPLGLVEDW